MNQAHVYENGHPAPQPGEPKQTAHLESWLYLYGIKLMGVVSGHPAFQDGKTIITGHATVDMNKMTAETANTIYTLGAPFNAGAVSL